MYPRVLGKMPKINHSIYYKIIARTTVINNMNLFWRIFEFILKAN